MYLTNRKCSECGAPIDGWDRGDRTTCGPRCRKARQRRQAQAKKAFSLAMAELAKIRDSLKRREQVDSFKSELQRLKAEINDLLLLAGDEDAKARQEMLEGRARRNW